MKLTSKGRYAVMALADLAKFNNLNPVSYSLFPFNSSLKLKIDTINGKKIIKRFNLSMASYKQLMKINSALEFIITMKK